MRNYCTRDEDACTPSEGDEHAIAEVMVRDLFQVGTAEKSTRGREDLFSSEHVERRRSGEEDKSMSNHVSKSQAMRAVVATKSDESLHPVIRMGWKPLCNVSCNGMNGIFWGGHDRDVYVQCTSPPYAGLPLVDVAYGGCMMTCSHFERISGRELSKKWKESIHVLLPDSQENSQKSLQRMTMYKWLKQQAACESMYGHGIVGRKIWICWFADARFYQGTVIEYKKSSGKHVVQYTAGRVTEELHLPLEKVDVGVVEPHVFPHADALHTPGNIVVSNPIWNQNSDVSLNIALDELQNSPTYAAAVCGVVRPRAQMHDEDSSKMPKSPPPKRTTSPSEQLLRRIAEACIDSPGDQSDDTTNRQIPPPPPYDGNPSVLQQKALAWMHRLAMELEGDVQEAYTGLTPGGSRVNPVTSFQVLLALATPDQRMGIFTALSELYSFHMDTASIEECRQKIAYMIAVCSMKKRGEV